MRLHISVRQTMADETTCVGRAVGALGRPDREDDFDEVDFARVHARNRRNQTTSELALTVSPSRLKRCFPSVLYLATFLIRLTPLYRCYDCERARQSRCSVLF